MRSNIVNLVAQFSLAAMLSAVVLSPVVNAQEGSALSAREFWTSLTPAERKLPRDILAQQRLGAGKAVPPGWEKSAQAKSKSRTEGVTTQLVRLEGVTAQAIESVIKALGATRVSSSPSRGYVVARLTDEQIVEASNYADIKRIRYVKGPKAQGVTQAFTAHRVGEMDGEDEPPALGTPEVPKPALTGEGVVVGIISNTIKQADLTALLSETNIADTGGSRLIPALYDEASDTCLAGTGPGLLFTLEGLTDIPDVIAPNAGTGAYDGLNMVQVIYDIAPKARIIIASPGDSDATTDGDQSTPGNMAAVIAQLVAGNGANTDPDCLPPVDIIVDDLDYLSQNPFEIDEVSEAIVAAKAAGVAYITAAGDGGHDGTTSTTDVYVNDFFSNPPPPSGNSLYSPVFDSMLGNIHAFASGESFVPYIELEVAVLDICLFHNENPNTDSEDETADDLILDLVTDLNEDFSDAANDFFAIPNPGACLSELESSFTGAAAGTKLIIEDSGGTFTDRFMLVAERATTTIVDASGADAISGVFDLSTPGSIRGHAYYPDVLTVGAAPFTTAMEGDPATEVVQAFKTAWETPANVKVNAYSADGEASDQARFYWENVGTNTPDWQAITGGLAAAKPDLVAASAISVKQDVTPADCDGNTETADEVCIATFHGTSASAAAAAGVAALYWELRQWQVDQVADDGLTAVVPGDVLAALRASGIDNASDGWDRLYGYGVLDAPKALETPLPAANASFTAVSPGAVKLDFFKALNDLSESFVYKATCPAPIGLADAELIPNDSSQAAADPNNKAPLTYNLDPDTAVQCTLTSHKDTVIGGAVTVGTTVTAVSPVALTMSAKSAGVVMRFEPSATASQSTHNYTAVCTAGGTSVAGWAASDNKSVTANTDYAFPVDPDTRVECTVTATVPRSGTTAVTATSTKSVTAGDPVQTTVTVTPDSGGVSVRWTVDPNLITGATAAVNLNCTQGSTTLFNGPVSGSAKFIETEILTAVSCSVSTVISGSGFSSINLGSTASASGIPEEFLNSGLPIWFLYQATQ